MTGVITLVMFGLIAQERSDQDLLQGTWKVVSAQTGKIDLDQIYDGRTLQFKDNRLIWSVKGSTREMNTYKIEPTKNPKEIDIFHPAALNPDRPLLGIYAIDGDRIKLSWSKIDGKHRPTSFELAPGNRTRQVSLVLERIKK
jgi:uncharacterized protein (TIGR03067 family)